VCVSLLKWHWAPKSLTHYTPTHTPPRGVTSAAIEGMFIKIQNALV